MAFNEAGVQADLLSRVGAEPPLDLDIQMPLCSDPAISLAGSTDPAGAALVREMRHRLARAAAELTAVAAEAAGSPIRAVLSDVDTAADEAVFVFALNPAGQD